MTGQVKNVLLLRFGELFLKGRNIDIFENMLIDNIKLKLFDEKFAFHKTLGRYIISNYPREREEILIEKLKQVFGLVSLSPALEVSTSEENIEEIISQIKLDGKTYKVSVKRADKTFPIPSMDYAKKLGTLIWNNNTNPVVDLYNPQLEVHVEIRNNSRTYIYTDILKCQGGLPLGSAGQALLLLSGGIDSPVAGYLMAKRGLTLHALHFHSYPYTSELAKQKVIDLAKQLSTYTGKIVLHCISFTQVQESIHVNCVPEYMITIMRRIMMRIAEKICNKYSLGAIITGESLGQVASQTMQSMTVTGSVVHDIPIFRPCIGMDKEQIMDISRQIGTYETSILPYEDCCTVFLPKNPVIKPTIAKAGHEESFLNIEDLVLDCLSNEEIIEIENLY